MSSTFALAYPNTSCYVYGMEPKDYLKSVFDRLAASGLSDAELCRRAGLAQTTLMRIRSGEMSPTIRTLERIEDALSAGESPAAGAGQ